MSNANILVAELRKTATLPATRIAMAVAILGSVAITTLNAFTVRNALAAGRPDLLAHASAFETAFAAMPLGTVGAVILGVITISSEYNANSPDVGGGRQVSVTLAAIPRRVNLLAAKAMSVVLLIGLTAAVTIPVSMAVADAVIGDAATHTIAPREAVTRCLGAVLYWTLTGLMAFAITVLTRGGTIPLLILIVNNSLVSFSLLLTKLTPLAHWLPDLAGRRLFAGLSTVEGGLAALPGAVVMAAWTAALIVVTGAVFARRDA